MGTDTLERRLSKLFSSPDQPNGSDRRSPPLPVLEAAPIRSQPGWPPAQPLAPDLIEIARTMVGSNAPEANAASASDDHDFLQTILDRIPHPVYVVDHDHTLVVVNSAYCALTGLAEEQLLGHADGRCFTPLQADEARALDERALNTGEASTVEQPVEAEDGSQRVWRIQRQPVAGPPDADAFLVVTIHDITERVEAENALKESDARHHTERAQLENKLRRLRRGLLFQFAIFGAAAGLAVSAFLAAHAPSVSADVVDTPTPAPIVVVVTTASTPMPQATNTPAPSPTASATPAPAQPQTTIAPTVTPDAFAFNESALMPAPSAAPLREFGPNVINIVLMGSDLRPGDGAWRTDVLILVSIDPDVPSVTMLSFPRDLWVYIPTWRWQRINLADGYGEESGFPGGGPALVKQVIQYNFGIPVHYYARVDFSGYKHLVDAVGGVDVVADCPLYDIFPDVADGATDIITGTLLTTVPTGTIDIPIAGVYHLDGKHALWYSRSRKTTSDFDRSRRQQRVLRALWGEMRDQGLLAQVPQLWDALTQSVETDLTLNDVVYLADVASRLDAAHIRSRFVDGSMLTWHVTETGANVLRYNFDELKSYLDEAFAPLPRNIAAQAPQRVDVLDASGHADWDLVAADRLGWAGFSVFSADRYGTVEPHSLIIDYTTTPKGSRLQALADLFQVAPENIHRSPDPSSPVAFDLIVGQDFEPCQPPSRGRWPAPPPTPTPTATPGP
ncbi:MAG TPA: LCP family protein [Anaerolineae bacterium]